MEIHDIVARYFTPEEVARGLALGNQRAALFAVEQVVGIAVAALLALTAVGQGWAQQVRTRWPGVRGLACEVLLVGALLTLATLPVDFYRGFVVEHQLGLSTQSVAGWLGDLALGSAIGYVLALLAVVVVHAVQVRWPRRWWVASWIGLTIGIFVFFFLQPILIQPLFNTFRPLERGPLRDGCERIARAAGIPITDVFVVDASRRTKRYNAFFTGVGSSRAIALHDTLVDGMSVPETLSVVGHEAGHWVHNHLMKGMAIASACVLLVLGFSAREGVLGAWPLARPGALARGVLLILVFQVLAMPVENGLSRQMEAEADAAGLALAGDPDAAVSMFVKLARSNVSNLTPAPAIEACLYSHPKIPDRIRMALAAKAATRPKAR